MQRKRAEEKLLGLEKLHPAAVPASVEEKARKVLYLENERVELENRVKKLVRSNPEAIEALGVEVRRLTGLVNSWTDNIYILRQFLCGKLGVPESVVNDSFGIPEELDVID